MNRSINTLMATGVFCLLSFVTHQNQACAGTFPITGNNATDPYLIMRASANACGEGDSVTCTTGTNGLTSNKYYSFFVEVPPGTGELRLELFDADVGLGGATEATAGRDTAAASYNYSLFNPAVPAVAQTTRFNRGTSSSTGLELVGTGNVSCQPGSPGSTGDNAWCLFCLCRHRLSTAIGKCAWRPMVRQGKLAPSAFERAIP